MQLDLYQIETAQIAHENSLLLDQAKQKIEAKQSLSGLEKNGVLYSLQVLMENAIGKSKQILKSKKEPVPVSAYDAFSALLRLGVIPESDLQSWNAVIGIRNRIVHEYMNIDMDSILEIIIKDQHKFIVDFLMKPIK